MSHAYHEGLAGYDAGNVFHDGCATCEERGAAGLAGLQALDKTNFAALVRKMVDAEFGDAADGGYPPTTSAADYEACRTLYAVAVLLERHFGMDPVALEGYLR